MELTDLYLNKYNPGNIPRDQFLEETSARKTLYDGILADIQSSTATPPPQHHLVVGPRGMGKTSVLYMVKYRVEDDEALAEAWLPLLFDEEEYGIGDLADFWLECIRTLEDAIGHVGEDSADALLLESQDDMEARSFALFSEKLAATGKRALLLIDNLNDILKALSEEDQHRLRALLMEDSRFLVVGTAASWFSAVSDREAPFFEFFRTRYLDRFTPDEMESVLRQLAHLRKDEDVLKVLDQQPERLRSLRILTGGNPRLVKMIYSLLREGLNSNVRRDLEHLLDECTPFFKHRIESLSLQARRIFDRIAKHWHPLGVAEIAPFVRKAPNYVSSVLSKLIDDGFVEEVGSSEKRKTYQVAERFYNIYYLMRFSREGRNRLKYLVEFMRVFYAERDYEKWLTHYRSELREGSDSGHRSENLCFLSSMAEASEDRGMKTRIYQTLFEEAAEGEGYREVARLMDQSDLKKLIGEDGFDIVTYLYGQTKERQKELGFNPDSAGWWFRVASWAWCQNVIEVAMAALDKTVSLDGSHAHSWFVKGVLLSSNFGEYEEARAAYEKALKINPKYADAWTGLGILLQKYYGEYEESREAYEKALSLNVKGAQFPLRGLAELALRDGDREKSWTLLRKALGANAESSSAQYLFLVNFAEELNTVRELLETISVQIEDHPELVNFLERVFRKLLQTHSPSVCEALLEPYQDVALLEPLRFALAYLENDKALDRIAPEMTLVVQDVAKRLMEPDPIPAESDV